jgi:hypothetical protein
VARSKYFSANGGIITQLKAEEGSLCERQKLDNLENRIQSRMLGAGGEERKDHWRGFDAAEHFIRLDMWFKLVAGESMVQRVQDTRDFRCFMLARNQISPRGHGRRAFDHLRKRQLLTGDPFPGSTLAGYDTTLSVDMDLARSYEANSKQGRKTLQEVIEGCERKKNSNMENIFGHWSEL